MTLGHTQSEKNIFITVKPNKFPLYIYNGTPYKNGTKMKNAIENTSAVELVLEKLDKMTPLKNDQTLSPMNLRIRKFQMTLLWIAVTLLAGIFMIVAWHIWGSPLRGGWLITAKLLVIVTMILSVLVQLTEIITGFMTMKNFNKDALNNFIEEIRHDTASIGKLIQFDRNCLELAQQWLELKAQRIRNHIGVFVGNSDKVAVFSMIGLGWAAWKELSPQAGGNSLVSIFTDPSLPSTIVVVGLALLLGIALGSIVLSYQLGRYAYQLELLALALKNKPERPANNSKKS